MLRRNATSAWKQCREIETACESGKAGPTRALCAVEFPRRRAACQDAQDQAFAAESKERTVENELLDMEAAYAQDELLTFITKAKYALHPLNLASAMAGLPCAIVSRSWECGCPTHVVPNWIVLRTLQFSFMSSSRQLNPFGSVQKVLLLASVRILPTRNQGVFLKTVVTTHPNDGNKPVLDNNV